jgi:hypothetical protein
MTMRLATRIATTAVSATALVALAGTAAAAGEVTGNGKLKWEDGTPAQSICAFSGQNDGFHDPAHAHGDEDNGRVQSYGQMRRTGETLPAFLHPGSACNGHTGFLSGGSGGH